MAMLALCAWYKRNQLDDSLSVLGFYANYQSKDKLSLNRGRNL